MAIGQTILDIVGIPPRVSTHKPQLKLECLPRIEHMCRVYLPMKEVVIEENKKLLDVGMINSIVVANG